MFGGLAQENHPMAKFMWGNLQSLSPAGTSVHLFHYKDDFLFKCYIGCENDYRGFQMPFAKIIFCDKTFSLRGQEARSGLIH